MNHTEQTTAQAPPAPAAPLAPAAPRASTRTDRGASLATTGAKFLFYAMALALALHVVLAFSAEAAYAQDAIEGTIQNAQDWLAGIMTTLGGLGLIASIGVKAVARTNENMHHAAHLGMTGSCIAVVAGVLLPDILDLVESFAGSGGGAR